MALTKTLTNPYVLGAGVLVGVGVLLFANRGSNEGESGFSGFANSIAAFNETALRYNTEVALAAYELEATRVENSTQRVLGALATSENMRAISASERVAKLVSDNGVKNTQIQTAAAIAIAKEQAAVDRQAISYAYKSSKKNAELDFFGDAIGTVGKVIGSIF